MPEQLDCGVRTTVDVGAVARPAAAAEPDGGRRRGLDLGGPALRRRALMGLPLAVYLIIALTMALWVPAWENNDEADHAMYVEYVLLHHNLPPVADGHGDEVAQPPLYYLTAGVWQKLFLQKPVNLSIPPLIPNLARPPHRVVLLQPVTSPAERHSARLDHLLRLYSVFCGAWIVIAAQMLGGLLFRGRGGARVASAALGMVVATWPKFLVISASVTNDILADTLCAWTILGAVWLVLRSEPAGRRRTLWACVGVGLAGGCATLSKSTALPVVAAVFAALIAVFAVRRRNLLAPGAMLAFAAVSCGWWMARNQLDYGDPLAAAANERLFNATIPGLVVNVPLSQPVRLLGAHLPMLARSFLYDGGWNQLSLPGWMNDAFWVGLGLSLAASVVWLRKIGGAERWPWVLVWVAIAADFGGWMLIASQTSQGEGRYLMVGLIALAAPMIAGFTAIRNRALAVAALALWPLFFLGADLYVLARYVLPYRGL